MEVQPHVSIAHEPSTSPDALWCLEQYYAELRDRFAEGFSAAKSLAADPGEFAPPKGAFLVVRDGGRAVGCGGIKLTSPDVAYIKRMWVDASMRGRGVGRELLLSLESTARELGCHTVQLETNRALTGAIRMYRAAGYTEVVPFNDEFYAHHWFEKQLSPAIGAE